ncbi:hypothetical protein B0H11DRAFT_2230009 [Mycena galericulata]|nr:hypothetical protein B0H11DRAFT_2230009 [Mycena galericulata]
MKRSGVAAAALNVFWLEVGKNGAGAGASSRGPSTAAEWALLLAGPPALATFHGVRRLFYEVSEDAGHSRVRDGDAPESRPRVKSVACACGFEWRRAREVTARWDSEGIDDIPAPAIEHAPCSAHSSRRPAIVPPASHPAPPTFIHPPPLLAPTHIRRDLAEDARPRTPSSGGRANGEGADVVNGATRIQICVALFSRPASRNRSTHDAERSEGRERSSHVDTPENGSWRALKLAYAYGVESQAADSSIPPCRGAESRHAFQNAGSARGRILTPVVGIVGDAVIKDREGSEAEAEAKERREGRRYTYRCARLVLFFHPVTVYYEGPVIMGTGRGVNDVGALRRLLEERVRDPRRGSADAGFGVREGSTVLCAVSELRPPPLSRTSNSSHLISRLDIGIPRPIYLGSTGLATLRPTRSFSSTTVVRMFQVIAARKLFE